MPADRLGMRQYHALLCGSRLHGDGDRADAGLRLTRGRSRRLGARAGTVTAAAGSTVQTKDRLQRINDLFDQGLISEQERKRLRSQILSEDE